jgi:hypothetical protein
VRLDAQLSNVLSSIGLSSIELGRPALVEASASQAKKLFETSSVARPSKHEAYAAARAFLQGHTLDSWQRDVVASALAEPIKEHSGATVLDEHRFASLLAAYDDEASRGELWRLTWHGLLYSYFCFRAAPGNHGLAHKGWEALRSFLERTWPLIDRQAADGPAIPDWINVLRREAGVLSAKPALKYAAAYLIGETEPVERLAADLGIPPSSWFWQALVADAVRQATSAGDAEFCRHIPRLLELIDAHPGMRDDAVESILIRYHACKSAAKDERLCDYVCDPTVWKNPKLKAAGIATAWNRVPDAVWRMVLGWVNERNLKDFFDILASRNKADEGRLAFWSKYLKQIEWTRLVFGAETMLLKRTNPDIRDLIAREEGAYAELTSKREVDAFMMQLGSYLIIEFSKKPNACYVYKADQLPFEPYSRAYAGNTADLAAGFHGEHAARIVHVPGWQTRASEQLRGLGIYPDAPERTRRVARTQDQPSELEQLSKLLERYAGAVMTDSRQRTGGGRLWIEDPHQRVQLGDELKSRGFKWADSRQAWYLPE